MTQVVYGNSVEPGYTLESEYVDGECDACGKSVSIHYYESCYSGTINQQKSYNCSCGYHFSDDERDDYDSYDHEKYDQLAADMYVEDFLGLNSRTELLVESQSGRWCCVLRFSPCRRNGGALRCAGSAGIPDEQRSKCLYQTRCSL